MYALTNESLTVSVLDPQADQERFGTRYCTGGYIYQIVDAQRGALLSGPTYPDSFNWFDGQGIPDAFNLGPLREPTASAATALIIGIGICDLQVNQVREFCRWEVQQRPAAIDMRTEHSFEGFEVELQRTVELHRRTVRSTTRLKNSGHRPVPIRWFPHPFFPQLEAGNDDLCRLNIEVRFPQNEGYVMGENGFICRKNWQSREGYFQALDHDAHTNLVLFQKHPLLGLIAATCSYIPAFFAIWGNQHTFSWEPFLERTLAGGQETSWWIDYDF